MTPWIALRCVAETSPVQFAALLFWLHMNTVIWSLLPQNFSALSAWALSRIPMPTRVSETKIVTIRAIDMDTLRLRPEPVSEKTYLSCMEWISPSVLVAVDAGRLVAYDAPVGELDHALAHLVDDAGVVGGHDHGGPGAVDPVEQLHDADARVGIEVSGGFVGDQDLRPVHERAFDRDALLLTAGQLVGQPPALALETD